MDSTPLANAQGVDGCHFSNETENVGVDFSWKSETEVGPVLTKEWINLKIEFFDKRGQPRARKFAANGFPPLLEGPPGA